MTGAPRPLTPALSPAGRGGRTPTQPSCCRLADPQQGTTGPDLLHALLTQRAQSSIPVFPPPGRGRVREGVSDMPAYRNDSQRLHARAQRASMTPAERALWAALRNHRLDGLSVRRKAPVGHWIADFLIPAHRIAICIDPDTAQTGTDHPPHGALEPLGFTVLRVRQTDILTNLPRVLRTVAERAKGG